MPLNDLSAGSSVGYWLVWMVGEPYQLICPYVRKFTLPRVRSLNGRGWICALKGTQVPKILQVFKFSREDDSAQPLSGVFFVMTATRILLPTCCLLGPRTVSRRGDHSCDRVSSLLGCPKNSAADSIWLSSVNLIWLLMIWDALTLMPFAK